MNLQLRRLVRTGLALLATAGACTVGIAQDSSVGWHASMDRTEAERSRVAGPSAAYPPDEPPTLEFSIFPTVYELPFHYDNPVSGRPGNSSALRARMNERNFDGDMTPQIAAQLREIGPVIDPAATAAIYVPLHDNAPGADIEPVRDVKYGTHERNVVDVFSNASPGDARPVVVFVHGGGFERGAKNTPGSPFYDNVMRWAVSSGYVGVNVNYRLAPEFVWPSGIEDIEAVVGWIRSNIAGYGGDARKVFLWGHSAGAAHVADYLAAQSRSGRDPGVAGAILLSGFYDLGTEVSMWESYYGSDVSTYSRRSSLPGLLATTIPLLIVDAELDPQWAQEQAERLTQAYREQGSTPQRLHLAGHSHLSESYAVGTSDRTLTDPVARFIRASLAQG